MMLLTFALALLHGVAAIAVLAVGCPARSSASAVLQHPVRTVRVVLHRKRCVA